MKSTNMTRSEERAWVRMARSGELRRLFGTDDAHTYRQRLSELAQSIEAGTK